MGKQFSAHAVLMLVGDAELRAASCSEGRTLESSLTAHRNHQLNLQQRPRPSKMLDTIRRQRDSVVIYSLAELTS